MNQIVIKVDNISKQYRLGTVGTGTLSHDINRAWHRIRGKEDPYLKIGESNDRTKKSNSDYVWALRDINFEVRHGEVLGIIGRNGAGKSTLLKILSRTTAPTEGAVKIKGRVASLLEVGTGFHPELSGRENIFLNGAILGMTKNEIKKKFDEIVDFAGVEKYIDTPVKRYSSGMYVRLAFGVAAHLEPEILIIDEVLAVGDAEFQKKALGKMKDVSTREGRTVLFVSHNMAAINTLCDKSLLMNNGRVESIGKTDNIIAEYFKLENKSANLSGKMWDLNDAPGDSVARLLSVQIINKNQEEQILFNINDKVGIKIRYSITDSNLCPVPNIHVTDNKGDYVFVTIAKVNDDTSMKGIHTAVVWIKEKLLNVGRFNIGVAVCTYTTPMLKHFFLDNLLSFETIEDSNRRGNNYNGAYPGLTRPELDWENYVDPT